MQAGATGGLGAGEVVVGRDVGDPGRLTRLPHPAGQALARRNLRAAAHLLEVGGVGSLGVPRFRAAQRLRAVGRGLPHGTQAPAEALADRREHARVGVTRVGRLGQAARHRVFRPREGGHGGP